MLEMIGSVLPIILLFSFGWWCKKTNFITEEGMAQIKKLIMSVALPSVLFLLFVDMEIGMEHITLLGLTFILLTLFMIGGRLFNFIPPLYSKYNPFLSTGYAFGLVGIGLFSMLYGTEYMVLFSIMGLAHEIFIWVFYYLTFRMTTQGKAISGDILLKIFKSPVIIGMLVGIGMNVLGLSQILHNNAIGEGLMSTLGYFASISTPLMLIVIGYGINFDPTYLKQSVKLIAVRLAVMGIVGTAFKLLVVDQILTPSPLLDASYIAFCLMPPVFVLSLFVSEEGTQEDTEIVSSAIGIGTVVGILLFILYSFIAPTHLF